jgi:hypothetical protein
MTFAALSCLAPTDARRQHLQRLPGPARLQLTGTARTTADRGVPTASFLPTSKGNVLEVGWNGLGHDNTLMGQAKVTVATPAPARTHLFVQLRRSDPESERAIAWPNEGCDRAVQGERPGQQSVSTDGAAQPREATDRADVSDARPTKATTPRTAPWRGLDAAIIVSASWETLATDVATWSPQAATTFWIAGDRADVSRRPHAWNARVGGALELVTNSSSGERLSLTLCSPPESEQTANTRLEIPITSR